MGQGQQEQKNERRFYFFEVLIARTCITIKKGCPTIALYNDKTLTSTFYVSILLGEPFCQFFRLGKNGKRIVIPGTLLGPYIQVPLLDRREAAPNRIRSEIFDRTRIRRHNNVIARHVKALISWIPA